MKRKVQQLNNREKIETLDALYTAVSVLKNREEIKMFLRDLLTESERIMLGRRILIARMLISGKTWEKIIDELKVGPDTIQRVEKWLDDQFPGYEKVIEGMKKEIANRKISSTFSLKTLKKKYPSYFLLFPPFDHP
ncbi:MAG: YerC/YecD family TrpR-related protein [Patescibacteria group bacterium]